MSLLDFLYLSAHKCTSLMHRPMTCCITAPLMGTASRRTSRPPIPLSQSGHETQTESALAAMGYGTPRKDISPLTSLHVHHTSRTCTSLVIGNGTNLVTGAHIVHLAIMLMMQIWHAICGTCTCFIVQMTNWKGKTVESV